MKKKLVLLLTLILLLVACDGGNQDGSGKVITEERDVSGFDKVHLTGSGVAEIIQGDSEGLVIEAEDNIMSSIESKVENGVLILGQKPNFNFNLSEPIKYTVTMIDITGLELSGSGDINAASVDTSIFELGISGSGKIDIDELDGDSMDVNISGSGDATLSGNVADQVVDIAGSGKYEAGDLKSQTAVVTVSGSGSAVVWVDTTLEVDVAGSGDVSYYGEPILTQSTSGSGEVKSLGAK